MTRCESADTTPKRSSANLAGPVLDIRVHFQVATDE